jgi:ABC-type Fe3+-siderophore transport system permease subunit
MKSRTPVENTGLGITFGAGLGVVVGVLVGGKALPIAIAIGAGLGVVFGSAVGARRKRRKE